MAAQFGRRLRRGATTTAVAAVAIAALAASQAPGATSTSAGGGRTADATPPPGTPVTGNSPYITDLPPLTATGEPSPSTGLPTTVPSQSGIPGPVLAAYMRAEKSLAGTKPGCNLPWQLLAAIGQVESTQARGGKVDAEGTTKVPILGPVLNGAGFANISDTDHGQYDGDTVHDRAIGPMQFIPSTWETWGQDGNGDGARDPNNIYDAALAAGNYLCANGRDLSTESDLHSSILGYNNSQAYLKTVLSWLEYYKNGTYHVPEGAGVLPVGTAPSGTGPAGPGPTSPAATTPSPSSTPSDPGGPAGPGPSGSPSGPSTPVPPSGTPKPTPPRGGGGSTTPPPGGSSPSTPTLPAVKQLEKVGGGTLTATAGALFGDRAGVRAEDATGRPVRGVSVRFEIVGTTDSRFTGGSSTATVTTGVDGLATGPAVQAGDQAGDFTVRATVRGITGVDFAATVTARQADALVRTGAGALTAAPGAEFANAVEVKATDKGAAAPGVAVTATMITSEGDATVPGAGPYFKDAAGNPLRSLKDLKTDANGVLQLPKIYADDAKGTFLLRLETTGGATLTIDLTVA
jgi:hypothetical protein